MVKHCVDCPLFERDFISCEKRLGMQALDLINRMKSENERLKNDLAISKKEIKRYATKTTNHKHHKGKHCFLNHTILHIIVHLAFHLVLHGVLEHIIH